MGLSLLLGFFSNAGLFISWKTNEMSTTDPDSVGKTLKALNAREGEE